MDISAGDNKLRKAIENEADCKRQFGVDMARKIRLRVAALRAAESLADFWPPKSGPERCHELEGGRKGTFSMDLKQPYRLLFEPAEEPLASNPPDEQERWKAIKAIKILAIEDTHG